MQPDFLIVGLGNPGKQYRKTRHNAGFLFCDYLEAFFDKTSRFGPGNTRIFDVRIGKGTGVVARPLTFMNRSGTAVKALLETWPVDLSHMMIVYDDFHLPLGTLRIRATGSSGNHNGIQSVIDEIGTSRFPRMRLGIGPEEPIEDSVRFVLSNFSTREWKLIHKLFPICLDALKVWLDEGIDAAMSRFNKQYELEGEEKGG